MSQPSFEQLLTTAQQQLEQVAQQAQRQQALHPTETAALMTTIAQLSTTFVALRDAAIAMQQHEERWQFALEANGDGLWDWNTQTDKTFYSHRWKKMLGYGDDEISDAFQEWETRLHPDDKDYVQDETERHIRGEIPQFAMEYRMRCKDGSYKWILDRGHIIQWNADGSPLRLIGIHTDISDRKQTEEQLRLLESVVLNIREAVLITAINPDTFSNHGIVYANPAFTQMTGYSLEEVLGCSPRFLQGKHTNPTALAQICAALQNQRPIQIELINYDRSGQEFWVDLSLVPLHNSQGQVTHWVSVRRNITARKQVEADLRQLNEELELRVSERTAALRQINQQLQVELNQRQQVEAALRQSEQFLRLTLSSAQAGSWDWNVQTGLGFWSPETFGLYGVEPAFGTPLFQEWLALLHPEDRDRVNNEIQRSLEEKAARFRSEFRILHPQWGVRWLMGWGSILYDDQGQPLRISGIDLDISDRRSIEQMKSEFISIVSHELRTPLTAIRGSLGLLNAGVLDDEPDTVQSMLKIASDEAERLVRLVNDVLDLERLEGKKMPFYPRWCDAAELVQQAINALSPLAKENHITLAFSPHSIPIWADPDRIVQTLVNLISNALKFSRPQGTIWLHLEHRSSHPLDDPKKLSCPQVLFSVRDEGRGIPSDKLESIFGQFQQADASDSRKRGGTGLGLAICRNIIQQHGGQIWAESVAGQGSTFYFTLPIPLEEGNASQTHSGD